MCSPMLVEENRKFHAQGQAQHFQILTLGDQGLESEGDVLAFASQAVGHKGHWPVVYCSR